MRYMWRKLWYDLRHGWKYSYVSSFMGAYAAVFFMAIVDSAPATVAEYFVNYFIVLLSLAAPLQMDKAMHLCPMGRREKRRYLLQYYWMRFGVCLGLSVLIHLAMIAAGWLSLPLAGLELLLQAVYTLAVLSVNLPGQPQGNAQGSGRENLWRDTGGYRPLKKENIGVLLLFWIMVVRVMLFSDIQHDLQEQRKLNGFECGAAAVIAGIVLVMSAVYIAKVLPRTLAECSDYENSCRYFRVE